MCAASRNFSPPNFTKGILRRVSSTSSAGAVMGRAKQHGLRFEANASFAVGKDRFDDVAGLCGVIGHIDKRRKIGRSAVRPEVFGEPLGGKIDDGIGGGKDRLRRAVISFQRDHFSLGREVTGKIEDVAHGCCAEGVDRLRIVTNDREAAPGRLKVQQDRGLKRLVS